MLGDKNYKIYLAKYDCIFSKIVQFVLELCKVKQSKIIWKDEIETCDFPYLEDSRRSLTVSGLCSVLRYIIKCSDDEEKKKLLSHKGNCLKAPSEVSAWTRYCEIELPTVVSGVDDKQIIRFENHLSTPVSLSNGRFEGLSADPELENCLECRKNFAGDHLFTDGPKMTLADLILFINFSLINKERLETFRLIRNWYRRVLQVPCIIQTSFSLGLTTHDFSCACSCEKTKFFETNSISIRENVKPPQSFSISQLSSSESRAEKHFNTIKTVNKEYDPLDWDTIPLPLHPSVPDKRKLRKKQQLDYIIGCVNSFVEPGQVIVDMCAGSGHLGLVLANLRPDCTIIVVESKEESIERCYNIREKLGLNNLKIYFSQLSHIRMKFDFGVALHACGSASDSVIEKCLEMAASLVLVPCCYGSIRRTHNVTYPRSKLFNELEYENYLAICRIADQHSSNKERSKRSSDLIDTDRLKYVEECGYSTCFLSQLPEDSSPKNNLLICLK
ncbi:DgyrCDS10000 [Dimorphilus gyrociliatus]|uniref:DgyrCDS10000 n=1 Tax=Dimorphilus gyrociliatus TaxID=2664684 RepID=A0A7I8VYT4_9ANNE|nr:DgyrCDS10000 [Dimorphilus gyrociliatus]